MSFIDGLNTLFDSSSDQNISSTCTSEISHYKFYQFSLIPSVAITLILSVTIKRREMLLSIWGGRPGLLMPMDALTRNARLSYAAAFGSTSMLVYKILLEQKLAIDYDGPISLKTLIAILSMMIYGTVYIPIFASLVLRTALSYGLGTLFIWTFTAVDFYTVVECELTDAGRTVIIVRQLPTLLCHSYLSISLPIRFVRCLRKGVYVNPVEETRVKTVNDVKTSYMGKHVTNLLKKPKILLPPEGFINKLKTSLIGILHKWFYHWESGFRYPSRLLSVMLTAGIVVYALTVEILVMATAILDNMDDHVDKELDLVGRESTPYDVPGQSEYRDALLIGEYIADLFRTCLIVSIAVTTAISYLTILHMLSNYRTNLYAMYRGDYRLIPDPNEKGAPSHCIGCIKYAGYQVAYIVWAYTVMLLVLLLVSMVLAVIIIAIIESYTDWLLDYVLQILPGVAVTLFVLITQMMLAKKVFLQNNGEYLRLNNRRFFFFFTYFMFFYNIFLGLVSCLLRIIKAMGVGIIFLARLDNSTLPRKFEFFDPGFSAYQGYIHTEAAHTHPVAVVFIQLLQAMSHEHHTSTSNAKVLSTDKRENGTGDCELNWVGVHQIEQDEEKKEAKRKAYGARFQWWVTYTLLQNPQVRMYRKGYIQAMRRARKEGIRIPISDLPISEFDFVKMQMEKEQERLKQVEENKKRKHKENNQTRSGGGGGAVKALVMNNGVDGVEMSIRGEKSASMIDADNAGSGV